MIDGNSICKKIKYYLKENSKEESDIALMQFLCLCFEFIEVDREIPDVGKRTFSVAREYWGGHSNNADELEKMRVACWDFLDSKQFKAAPSGRAEAIVRALMCTTYPEPIDEDFLTDCFEWFFQMFNRLGDFSGKVQSVMKMKGYSA